MSSTAVDNVVVTDADNHSIELITSRAAAFETNQPTSRVAEQVLSARLEVETEPETVLPMRLNGDALSDLVILARGRVAPTTVMTAAAMTFIVTNTNDGGPGSLRQAILDANGSLVVWHSRAVHHRTALADSIELCHKVLFSQTFPQESI